MSASKRSPARLLLVALRVVVSLGAFAYVVARIDRRAFAAAIGELSPSVFFGAVALVVAIVGLGTLRWTLLLSAYGAERGLSPRRALHLYLVGYFYNMYLPGGLGGDLVRSVAAREAFPGEAARGATAGIAVVFIERVFGLAGLIALCSVVYFFRPVASVRGLGPAAAVGAIAAAGAVAGVALGRRLADRLPGPLGRVAARLPELRSARPLVVVFGVCVAIHALVACTGHLLVHALAPEVRLADSLILVPLSAAAGFFPLTVGGAGVREAAFTALYAAVGVPEAAAFAGSLALFAVQLFVAAWGGLVHLFVPLDGGSPGLPPGGFGGS
jgi:uncharacterized membrane protein YbhN (UPF0104 family)